MVIKKNLFMVLALIFSGVVTSVSSADDIFKGKDIFVSHRFNVLQEGTRNIFVVGDAAKLLYRQMGSDQIISHPGEADNVKQSANIKCVEAIVSESVTYRCEMHMDSKGNLGFGRAWE